MDSQCVTDVLFLVSLYLNFSSRSYSPSSDLPPLLGVSSWWVKTGHCYPRASPDRGWRWSRKGKREGEEDEEEED